MKTILREISYITNTIETDYPDLYKFLDKEPITIAAFQHPDLEKKLMNEYHEDLKALLKHYMKTHQKKSRFQ